MPEHQQIQQSKKPDTIFQNQSTLVSQTPASNPYSIIQRAKINPKSLTHADIMQLQRTIGNRAVGMLLTGIGNTSTVQQAPVQRQETPEEETCPSCMQRQEIPEEEEPLQGKMIDTIQRQEIPEEEEPLQGKMVGTVQRQEIPEEEEPLQTKRENNTGMPDNLKAGVENLSGIGMSDVRVHYNSSKPTEVGALAYTQGTDIHVATGQKRHLPHETWHVVQQAQGRVKPTMQLKDGVPVNDEKGLEQEADVMGAKALVNTAQFKDEPEEKELMQNRSAPSVAPVQAIFQDPIKSMIYADIKKQLEQTYENVPVVWKIIQLASVSDKHVYRTLEEVAVALNLAPLAQKVGTQSQSVQVPVSIAAPQASKRQTVIPDDIIRNRHREDKQGICYFEALSGGKKVEPLTRTFTPEGKEIYVNIENMKLARMFHEDKKGICYFEALSRGEKVEPLTRMFTREGEEIYVNFENMVSGMKDFGWSSNPPARKIKLFAPAISCELDQGLAQMFTCYGCGKMCDAGDGCDWVVHDKNADGCGAQNIIAGGDAHSHKNHYFREAMKRITERDTPIQIMNTINAHKEAAKFWGFLKLEEIIIEQGAWAAMKSKAFYTQDDFSGFVKAIDKIAK